MTGEDWESLKGDGKDFSRDDLVSVRKMQIGPPVCLSTHNCPFSGVDERFRKNTDTNILNKNLPMYCRGKYFWNLMD